VLVNTLGELPGACEWYEPNALWRVGHAYRSHDAADESDAKPWVKRWIRQRFLAYQQAHGEARVIEKSPYNVLRLRFIHAIFPEAKIIHIHRDGRANLRSQVEKGETFMSYQDSPKGHTRNRLKEVPFWELPAYAPRVVSGVWRTYVRRKPISWFGLRYPGWRRDRKQLSLAQIAAKQWVTAVRTALDDLQHLPENTWMAMRYEDMVQDPQHWFKKIVAFIDHPADAAFWEHIQATLHQRSARRWIDELDPEVLDQAMPIMGDLLEDLGYLDETRG
jgi:hypothetical protein